MADFITYLQKRVSNGLPGLSEQLKMAPEHRQKRIQIPTGVKHNGVLILLHANPMQPSVIFTLRSTNLNDHSGQFCYPGGSVEPHETLEEAAFRELNEEIGVSLEPASLIGKLTPLYVPPSENLIHPFLAYYQDLPELRLQPEEVSEVLRVSLEDLINPENVVVENWNYKGQNIDVPYWSLHRVPLWGATAMITSELAALYREFNGR